MSSNLCISCHSRPKFVDGSRTHNFCGKTCARKGPQIQTSSALPGNCDVCHARPKYFDGTKTHNYCSRTCARNASQAIAPTTSLTTAASQAPCLVEIQTHDAKFAEIAGQFRTSWRHAGTAPPVKAVYKVICTKASLATYDAYRAAVEARGHFTSVGRSAGNECRRWHGTNRGCHLGEKGHINFCSSAACSLCCILKTSYKLQAFGKKTGWGRFGAGIYVSSTSSKSNDYQRNLIQSSWKAMILNKVVVGKGYKMKQDNSSLTAAPNGYDSVLGETGGSLNHDECILYSEDAVRPSWLVMYA